MSIEEYRHRGPIIAALRNGARTTTEIAEICGLDTEHHDFIRETAYDYEIRALIVDIATDPTSSYHLRARQALHFAPRESEKV